MVSGGVFQSRIMASMVSFSSKTPVCLGRSRSVWILVVTEWGNDFREVAPASVYLGEMILDVTLIMYAAVDAGLAEETY